MTREERAMGNRAVITDTKREMGVYLHWNGGRDSVEAFLKYCELKGYRSPSSDCYGWARLCQVIGNFFGGGTSVGVMAYTTDDRMNPGDNGIYVIEGWEIVDRVYPYGGFGEQAEYDMQEMLEDIDARMPEHDRLGARFLRADLLTYDQIEVGDMVWEHGMRGVEPRLVVHKLTAEEVGFKDWCAENGQEAPSWAWTASRFEVGTPVTDAMLHNDWGLVFMDNVNSYLRTHHMEYKADKTGMVAIRHRVTRGVGLTDDAREATEGVLARYHAEMEEMRGRA